VLPAEGGDGIEFRAGEDFAGGVVGGIEEEHAGLRGKRPAQLFFSKVKIRGMEGDKAGRGPGEGNAGPVGIVEWLEDDYFIAGIEQSQHGVGDGFGATVGDGDFCIGIDRKAGGRLEVLGDGLVELGDAVAAGVLIVPGPHGLHRCVFDEFRAVEVGETLAEIDRLMLRGEAGHLGEDGFSEGL